MCVFSRAIAQSLQGAVNQGLYGRQHSLCVMHGRWRASGSVARAGGFLVRNAKRSALSQNARSASPSSCQRGLGARCVLERASPCEAARARGRGCRETRFGGPLCVCVFSAAALTLCWLAEDYQLLPDFRIRIMPVVATVPAAVGCAAAAFVLNALSGKLQEQPMLPLKAAANRASKMVYDLVRSEDSARFASSRGERTMLVDDAVWVLTQVFSGRCAISGCVDDLTLRRWRLDRPASVSNVVVLSKKLAKKHQEAESLETLYSAEQIARVDGLLAREPHLVTRLKTWV